MCKTLAVLGTGLGLLLCHPAPSSAQTPDATIQMTGGSVAAGVGYTWGHGTLFYQGKMYPIRIAGLSLASVGADQYVASGSVTGLQRPEDISGTYTSVNGGVTMGGGADIAAMRNGKGVTILMASTNVGVNVTLAAEGLQIALGE